MSGSLTAAEGKAMPQEQLSEVSAVRAARARHCFALQGDLGFLDADLFLIPTDAYGTVERHWSWALGSDEHGDAMQLHRMQDELSGRGHLFLDGPAGRVLALDVAGMQGQPSLEAMVDRFSQALESLEQAGLSTRHRARPLVAMPLIGIGRAGMGSRTGEVIAMLLDAIDRHFSRHPGPSFDLAIVTREASSLAALQHERRKRITAGGTPEWLAVLAKAAGNGELAVMFGAGASAALGLPMWSELLEALVDALGDSELAGVDLSPLDPVDAATILVEARGREWFLSALAEILSTDRHSLTHGLIANLHAPLVITTNYDQAYELAAEAIENAPVTVLPWDADTGSRARVLKLHGDLTRGQLVLSRDQFVAMHAFRRPLAGVLQSRMLIGHLLAVGTSMSDATLVHAAEEFRALIRQAHEDAGEAAPSQAGTVVLTAADPARVLLLERAFTVVVGEADAEVRENARDVDVLLDWLAMQASSDLSFALDPRYEALLGPDDRLLADQLRELAGHGDVSWDSPSALGRRVDEFLRSLGDQRE